MKRAWPLFPPSETAKSPATPLNTVPVGPPATVTVSACFAPAPLYSVDVFVPLFDVHHGVVGPATRPQPFTRFESAAAALPVLSATRLFTAYLSSCTPAPAVPARSAAAATATTAKRIVVIELLSSSRGPPSVVTGAGTAAPEE